MEARGAPVLYGDHRELEPSPVRRPRLLHIWDAIRTAADPISGRATTECFSRCAGTAGTSCDEDRFESEGGSGCYGLWLGQSPLADLISGVLTTECFAPPGAQVADTSSFGLQVRVLSSASADVVQFGSTKGQTPLPS